MSPPDYTEGGDTPWRLGAVPEAGSSDVPTLPVVRVQLDRRVFPQAVAGRAWLQSGESRPTVSVDYDPVTRSLLIAPRFELLTFTAYSVRVEGLIDLDGVAQPEPFASVFATGGASGEREVPRPPDWPKVAALLQSRCVGNDCHGGDRPALGLDLSSAEAIERTAIGVASRQAIAGASGMRVPRGALTLFGLPIIDRVAERGRMGTSYLLYKVLGDGHVVGAPMPPEGDPLDDRELALLRDWIQTGADTPENAGSGQR